MIDKKIETTIAEELKTDARALGIPSGAAEVFIEKSLTAAKKAIKTKKIITMNDLERAIYRELKKYNGDLAYVFQNRDKII